MHYDQKGNPLPVWSMMVITPAPMGPDIEGAFIERITTATTVAQLDAVEQELTRYEGMPPAIRENLLLNTRNYRDKLAPHT